MKTVEMEYALVKYFGVDKNLIVTNASFGVVHSLHECDLLVLSKSNYATEVEIKVNKYDLLKDKEKKHNHDHIFIKNLYFAVPEGELVELALKEIPKNAGLLSVKRTVRIDSLYPSPKIAPLSRIGHKVSVIRNSIPRKNAYKWEDKHVLNLYRLAAMRLLKFSRKIFEYDYEKGVKNV